MFINKLRSFSTKSSVNFIVLLIIFSFTLSGLSSFFFLFKGKQVNCFFSIKNKCLDSNIRVYIDDFIKKNNIKTDDQQMILMIIKKKISDEVLRVIADDLRIAISDDYIFEYLKKDKSFREKDVFNMEKFNNFLKQNNLSQAKYFEEIRIFIMNSIISSLFYYNDKNLSETNLDKDYADFYKQKYLLKSRKYHITEFYKELSDIKINPVDDKQILEVYKHMSSTLSILKKLKLLRIKNGDKINFRGGMITVNADNISTIGDYIKEKIKSEDLSFFEKKFRIKSQEMKFYNNLEENNLYAFDQDKLIKNNILSLDDNIFNLINKQNKSYLDFNSSQNQIDLYYYISSEDNIKLSMDLINTKFLKNKIEHDARIEMANKMFRDKNFKFFKKRRRIIQDDDNSLNISLVQIIKDNELRQNKLEADLFLKVEMSRKEHDISFFCLEKIEYLNSISGQQLISFIKDEREKEVSLIDQNYNNYIYNKYNIKIRN